MAQINHAAPHLLADPTLFAALASLCLLLCMITALLGIKLWWFKHRLNFEHSSTRNGAAGGSQPSVVPRQRSAKDKRLSQQFHDSVEVHGVFRKREEDELDITPTAQLPPVRLRKLSQSTPALFLPPPPARRQQASQQVETAQISALPPPTRLPPRPPAEFMMPSTPVYEIKPTYEEYASPLEQTESSTVINSIEQNPSTSALPPQAPKRANRNISSNGSQEATTHKFIKTKSSSDIEEYKKLAERRPTGYIKPSVEELDEIQRTGSTEEFGERRPTGYIKYEEIDHEGLQDFREKWHNVHKELRGERGRLNYETVYPQEEYLSVKERRPTSYIKDSEKMWQDVELEMAREKEKEHQKQQSQPVEAGSNPNVTQIYATEENDETQPAEANKDFDNFGEKQSMIHNVTFAAAQPIASQMSKEKRINLKKRRPTGFVTRDKKYWDDLEREEDDSFESEENLWTEMQKDLDSDFAFNVEEEFNKIRHSYEANEGDFLEIKEELGKSSSKTEFAEPKGFGKSIDEDWDSFENLQNAKEKAFRKPSEPNTERVITFKLSDLEDADEKESTLRKERRPTGYVHNRADLFNDVEWLEEEDEKEKEDVQNVAPKSRVTFEILDEATDEKRTENSILKERRPTAYIKRDPLLKQELSAVHEFDAYFPEPARKPKPRQKVTFDFNNEEHYLPAIQTDSGADDDVDYTASVAARKAPQPRQRTTKTRFKEEVEESVSATPPILFSSQISKDDNINDSWTAIRKHRYMTEEFQQISLEADRMPAPRHMPQQQLQHPVPAYRNPLAQLAVSTTTLEVESESSYAKVTRKDQQTRQYFEHHGTSITEA